MKEKISRRKALKYFTLSPIVASSFVASKTQASDVKANILIVGGGTAGIIALSHLFKAIKNPNITIITPNEIQINQSGQVFVAAGVMEETELFLSNKDYINTDKVKWIKDEVLSFEPDANKVKTRAGEEVDYDYLIVATGLQYNYEKIKGLKKEDIGTHGISSVYLNDLEKGTARGASDTWKWFNDLKTFAKEKRPKVIFTHPNTAIKSNTTPQRMLFLSADYLKKDELSADFEFISSSNKLSSLPKIEEVLYKAQDSYDPIKNRFGHHLESLDVKAKKAVFLHEFEKEGIQKSERLELPYDFIHIVPPMSPVKALLESSLLSHDAWLDVDKYTLQHKKYKNVFGIGDTCATSLQKTASSAQAQGEILAQNILDAIQAKELSASFDGYSASPIETQYEKSIMLELNFKGLTSTLPIHFEKPRWIWWMFNLYIFKSVYKHLILRGRY
ncbi:MAG: FAD-dependent oxidoreductase [Sulfurimonas sp.]|nr:FAD-dependent oxidoreductase [Sulfurimonas sp.]MDQ7060552.1 FAD-dependent oxidoreductase [Sulfurimonas sp.]